MRRFAFGLILCLCSPGVVFAWGDMGHRAIVDVAIRQLSPDSRIAIEDLLGGELKQLVDAASWADEIIDEWSESYPWHAVDIPHHSTGYDRERDCGAGACIVGAIERFADEIGDRALSSQARVVALKMLIHLVGDLHMPLHAHAPDTSWNGWEGPWLRIGENTDQLHMWWDDGFVFEVGPNASAIAEELFAEITDDEVATWRRSTPEDWANESFFIARDFVVRHGLLVVARRGATTEDNPIVLRACLLEEVRPIVIRRLKMAGVRLAWLLNSAFDPSATRIRALSP